MKQHLNYWLAFYCSVIAGVAAATTGDWLETLAWTVASAAWASSAHYRKKAGL